MSHFTLLAIETAGIQSYIYSSNRLKENVGASYLVAAATGQWALEALTNLTAAHNLTTDLSFDASKQIDQDNALAVEVLYSGGGNFVALFRDDNLRKNFCRNLSRRVIVDAANLNIVFHHLAFDWSSQPLSHAVSDVLAGLRKQRGYQAQPRGIAGLSVTATCSSTNLPAIHLEEDLDTPNNYILYSAEALCKREAATQANNQLQELFDLSNNFTFALELDQLGSTKGERSNIAVVHADGNGLGVLIQGLKNRFPQPIDNRDYIEYMRGLSTRIKQVNQLSQQAMADRLLGSIEAHDGKYKLIGLNDQSAITLSTTKDGVIFPLRPLVSGGDDVTFVCDGRIAFELAVTFLQAFEHYSKEILDLPLTACAGIAIVNTHYPFARAYGLAEELTSSAKYERHRLGDIPSSALDWHYTNGGIYGDLGDMREREYLVDAGKLTLRPIFTSNSVDTYRTWNQLQRITSEFQTKWRDHRSKAKGLMSILREGAVETQIFSLRYLREDNLSLPEFGNFADAYGWVDGKCGYYDALELMDLYIPLKRANGVSQ